MQVRPFPFLYEKWLPCAPQRARKSADGVLLYLDKRAGIAVALFSKEVAGAQGSLVEPCAQRSFDESSVFSEMSWAFLRNYFCSCWQLSVLAAVGPFVKRRLNCEVS